jgi:hypothetical protein
MLTDPTWNGRSWWTLPVLRGFIRPGGWTKKVGLGGLVKLEAVLKRGEGRKRVSRGYWPPTGAESLGTWLLPATNKSLCLLLNSCPGISRCHPWAFVRFWAGEPGGLWPHLVPLFLYPQEGSAGLRPRSPNYSQVLSFLAPPPRTAGDQKPQCFGWEGGATAPD